ncbi:hypothetical protein L5M37_02320 [Shewanella sp. SM69]|uniref:hypothetical protein n=1 Tax=Shewanella sp. SM69 TaxID=2912802 RepID=UPI0021D97B80|nr:hypothetical protein [Shewanella sp. SM69]MCU8037334.1 hypothetical protein [Shewanella sp. SM69]
MGLSITTKQSSAVIVPSRIINILKEWHADWVSLQSITSGSSKDVAITYANMLRDIIKQRKINLNSCSNLLLLALKNIEDSNFETTTNYFASSSYLSLEQYLIDANRHQTNIELEAVKIISFLADRFDIRLMD